MSPTAVYLTLGISAVADLVGIGAIVWWIGSRKRVAADTVGRAEEQVRLMRQQAEREAETLRKEAQLEARERTHTMVAEAEAKARDRHQEIVSLEQSLADRTRALADRIAGTEKLERELRLRDTSLAELQKKTEAAAVRAEQTLAERQRELQRVASLTAEEARDLLLKQIEADARRDAANLVKRLENEARETAAQRAQHIITDAIQRSAADHAIETTVSVLDLPSDDMKGRIIGREGRNIRALEQATGVELIVDDTPGAIILSSSSGGRISASPPARWTACEYVRGERFTSTSQAAHCALSMAAQMPMTGRVTPYSLSNPRNFSQSVTAASIASISMRARFR